MTYHNKSPGKSNLDILDEDFIEHRLLDQRWIGL